MTNTHPRKQMTTRSQPILELRKLTRTFGALTAVNAIDLEIAEGEFFTIVGPSGSGKTTMLRMLAGMEQASSGDILLRGKRINDVPANRRPTCMVFQSLALFPHRTVGQNIEFPMKIRGVDPAKRKERAIQLMQQLRLPENYYGKNVTKCSGGERQRVALARALAYDPEILFFDEPLSAIDYKLRKTLEKELKDIHRETGKTFVYITHSLEEAMVMSDRIGVMQAGRLIQVGTPEPDLFHADQPLRLRVHRRCERHRGAARRQRQAGCRRFRRRVHRAEDSRWLHRRPSGGAAGIRALPRRRRCDGKPPDGPGL
jgi:spermidine/putrescine transport system ATP-binding protein